MGATSRVLYKPLRTDVKAMGIREVGGSYLCLKWGRFGGPKLVESWGPPCRISSDGQTARAASRLAASRMLPGPDHAAKIQYQSNKTFRLTP